MNTQNIQQLRRLDALEEARKKYQEVQWRLNFLRTISPQPPPQPTDDELLKWLTHLN